MSMREQYELNTMKERLELLEQRVNSLVIRVAQQQDVIAKLHREPKVAA